MTQDIEMGAGAQGQLISWLQRVRATGVTSFVEFAVQDPDGWVQLKHLPDLRRRIGIILGWPRWVRLDSISGMTALDVVSVVFTRGIVGPRELCTEMPYTSYALLRAGILEAVLEMAGIAVGNEEPDDGCADDIGAFHTLDALLQLGADKVGGSDQDCLPLVRQLPSSPHDGWPTVGGPVFELGELIVARFLEVHGVEFIAPAQLETREWSRRADAFRLVARDLWLCTRPGHDAEGGDMTGADMTDVIEVDSSLLTSPLHVIVFAEYLCASLIAVGVIGEVRLRVFSDLLSPKPLSFHDEDSSGRQY